ncbi:hypothetical protein FRC19_002634 [Serendipita sp. 401]|nr:hypothetical protein FRC19_002634 [Serendipita sp. 401]KAG9043455.1 hypothetical protein FS842_001805 [Serendipita sp. 407]
MFFGSKFLKLLLLSGFGLLVGQSNANNNQAHPPPQNYTLPPNVSLDRLFTIDTSLLAAPVSIVGGNCTAPTESLIRGGGLTVILPSSEDLNTTENLEHIRTKALNDSLPYLLQQLGVKHKCIPDLVDKGVPLLQSVINEALSSKGADFTTSLTRRGLLGDIGNFFEDVGNAIVDGVEDIIDGVANLATKAVCDSFAAGSLPGYHASVFGFSVLNALNTPRSTTRDQNFYIYPLHGNVYKDNISIYYRSQFPPGFEKAQGTTMGRRIYMRADRVVTGSDPRFEEVTRTLLHEFAHVKQYRSVGYDLTLFGLQYLYNFCKAGFDYESNVMEEDARAQVREINALFDPIGKEFFRIWRVKHLFATLGLPTVKSYRYVADTPSGKVYSLRLQGGVMLITCRGPSNKPVCS